MNNLPSNFVRKMKIFHLFLNLHELAAFLTFGPGVFICHSKTSRSPKRETLANPGAFSHPLFLGYFNDLHVSFSHCRLRHNRQYNISFCYTTRFLFLSLFSLSLCYPILLTQIGCLRTILNSFLYLISHYSKLTHPVGFFKNTVLLRYNSHIIQLTCLRCTIQYFLG